MRKLWEELLAENEAGLEAWRDDVATIIAAAERANGRLAKSREATYELYWRIGYPHDLRHVYDRVDEAFDAYRDWLRAMAEQYDLVQEARWVKQRDRGATDLSFEDWRKTQNGGRYRAEKAPGVRERLGLVTSRGRHKPSPRCCRFELIALEWGLCHVPASPVTPARGGAQVRSWTGAHICRA
jgi:hypothetical protein